MLVGLRMLMPRQQAGTRHHTHWIDMEFAKPNSLGRKPIQIGRFDFAGVTSQIRIADVVRTISRILGRSAALETLAVASNRLAIQESRDAIIVPPREGTVFAVRSSEPPSLRLVRVRFLTSRAALRDRSQGCTNATQV